LTSQGHLGHAGVVGVDRGDLQAAGLELGPGADEIAVGRVVRGLPAEVIGDVGDRLLPAEDHGIEVVARASGRRRRRTFRSLDLGGVDPAGIEGAARGLRFRLLAVPLLLVVEDEQVALRPGRIAAMSEVPNDRLARLGTAGAGLRPRRPSGESSTAMIRNRIAFQALIEAPPRRETRVGQARRPSRCSKLRQTARKAGAGHLA